MRVINSSHVDNGLYGTLSLLMEHGEVQETRAGKVMAFKGPVTVCHAKPDRMVSACKFRNANPFFHYFESLWMLTGSRDATFLDEFVKDFSNRFAESDGVQWGAYGHRWRFHFGKDQLNYAVEQLKANHNDRRVVIQMWDPSYDIPGDKRDHPCNISVIPRIRNGTLDITVHNRSNDIIWGTFGSNAVHFALLHQWLASQIGMDVGLYYQISANMHAYMDTMLPLLMHHNGRFPAMPAPTSGQGVRTFEKAVPLYEIDKLMDNWHSYDEWDLVDKSDSYFMREYKSMVKLWYQYANKQPIDQPQLHNQWTYGALRWLERRKDVTINPVGGIG